MAHTKVSTDKVFYVEANTDLTLTDTVLKRLARFAGMPDLDGRVATDLDGDGLTNGPNEAEILSTYWGFRVMPVNKVVQRKVADDTIDVANPDESCGY